MTFRLESITLENFRSFAGPTVVGFAPDGLTLIKGVHTAGGSASGTGKSSVLMGIAYALGFCEVPATELRRRNTKHFTVRLVLSDAEGSELVIERSPKLSVSYRGVTTTGKDAESVIYEVLRSPASALSAIAYRQQRTKGSFLHLTESQRREFLIETIGLSAILKSADAAKASLKKAESELLSVRGRLTGMTSVEERFGNIDEQCRSAEAALVDAQLEYDRVQRQPRPEPPQDAAALVSSELAVARSSLREATEAAALLPRLRSRISKLEHDSASIVGSSCPTCKQTWLGDKTAELERIKTELFTVTKEAAKAEMRAQKLAGAEAEVRRLQAMQSVVEDQRRIAADALRAWQSRRDAAQRSLAMVQSNLAALKDTMLKVERLRDEKAKLSQLEARLASEVRVLTAATEILGKNGFAATTLEELLSEVSFEVNEMLPEVPNVSHLSVAVTPDPKTDGLKLAIQAGLDEVSVRSLSGGQQAALELCMDLAVRKVAIRRYGSLVGWVTLDESMDGLDVEAKSAMLSVVSRHAPGQVVIIDHATEVQELFAKVVELRYDGCSTEVA